MIGLLDVNVLVALIVPEHQHHDVALTWYTGDRAAAGGDDVTCLLPPAE